MGWLPTFLAPSWLLLGIPALCALAYAYLRRQEGQRLAVGSTYLLSRIQRRTIGRKKFLPPLRFFLEALLMTYLLAVLAGILWGQSAERILIVLDNSQSTGAIVEESVLGSQQTVLDVLKAEIEKLLAKKSSAQFLFAKTSFRCALEKNDPMSAMEVESKLAAILPLAAQDEMEGCLRKLTRQQDVSSVHIFSDRTVRAAQESNTQAYKIVSHQIHLAPEQVKNIAIRNVSILPDQNLLHVEMQSFSAQASRDIQETNEKPAEGVLTVTAIRNNGQKGPEISIPFRFNSSDNKVIDAELPPGQAIAYFAEIKSTDWKQNRLISDDGGVAISGQVGLPVVVVSTQSSEQLGLRGIKGFSFVMRSPSDYNKVIPSSTEANLSIFHRFVPKVLPSGNLLFIAPTQENPHIQVSGLKRNLELSYVASAHPIANYVAWDLFQIPAATPFEAPPWAEDILRSSSSVLLFAGERDGRRIAATAFELFPYEGRASLSRSVLSLNLLRWLSAQASQFSDTLGRRLGSEESGYFLKLPTLERQAVKEGDAISSPGIFLNRSGKAENFRFFSESESGLVQDTALVSVTASGQSNKKDDLAKTVFRTSIAWLFVLYLIYWICSPILRIRKQMPETSK